jgi:hypothetical protein
MRTNIRKRFMSSLWKNIEEKPIRIIPDKKYPDMYRLQWKNGDVSIRYWAPEDHMDDGGPNSCGMYNLTRAKDILRNYGEYVRVMKLAKDSPLLRAKTVTDASCHASHGYI